MEGGAKELQMDPDKDVQTVDSQALRADCRERVNLGQPYDRYQQEITKILQEAEHMWDWILSRPGIAKHCMDLTSQEIVPFGFPHYWTGLNSWQIEKT